MNKKYGVLALVGILLMTFGCQQEFDAPEGHTLQTGDIITIADLKEMFATNGATTFTEDMSVFAVITASEESGNLYREAYLQDENGDAMHIYTLFPGGIYENDEIRINLKGTTLQEEAGHLSIIDVDVDNNVFKQATNQVAKVDTMLVNLGDIGEEHESQLIMIPNAQISSGELCAMWADPNTDPPTNFNRTIEDCTGASIVLRNSGYSNFAGQIMAGSNGFIVGVVSEFNGERQIKVRRPSDFKVGGERCGGEATPECEDFYLTKNFDDENVTSGGWSTYAVEGSVNWEASTFGSDTFARISNFNGTDNQTSEAWMISPAVDLTGASNPKANFLSAYNYTGDALEVYVSTNYPGTGNPNDYTWTNLNPVLSPGSWVFTGSGDLDLSSYLTANTRIGFKYVGSNSDGSTWEVDDITISE